MQVKACWRRYGVGVDVHSQFAAVCVLVPDHQHNEINKHERECSLHPAQLRECLAWVRATVRSAGIEPEPLVYAVESTATFHYPLVRCWGGQPIIVNPSLACQYKARKTDRFDASVLAYQALTGLWQTTVLPSEQTEQLRLLMRTRRKLLRQRTSLYNAVGTRLAQWYCPLMGATPRSKLIRAIVEDAERGEFKSGHPCFSMAHCVPNLVWQRLVEMYSLTDNLTSLASSYEKQAQQLVDQDLFRLHQSVPGVGQLTALVWHAEVEPAERFARRPAVVAYCGFDPTPMVSAGKTVATRCRKGNSHIRCAIVQAAHSALNGKSHLAAVVRRRANKHRNVLISMAGRRIVEQLYRISLTRRPYEDPSRGEEGSPATPASEERVGVAHDD